MIDDNNPKVHSLITYAEALNKQLDNFARWTEDVQDLLNRINGQLLEQDNRIRALETRIKSLEQR